MCHFNDLVGLFCLFHYNKTCTLSILLLDKIKFMETEVLVQCQILKIVNQKSGITMKLSVKNSEVWRASLVRAWQKGLEIMCLIGEFWLKTWFCCH